MEQSKVLMQTKKLKFAVMVCLYIDEECTTSAVGEFTTAEFTAPAAYNISTDKKAPVSIVIGAQDIIRSHIHRQLTS